MAVEPLTEGDTPLWVSRLKCTDSHSSTKGYGHDKMKGNDDIDGKDAASVREMLSCSGYSDKAIDYYLNRESERIPRTCCGVSERI